jgi:hypothetical protein
MKHKVQINVTEGDGTRQLVMRSIVRQIPKRLYRWLFGENVDVMVLTPGESVASIEIRAIKEGEKTNEPHEAIVRSD